MINHLLQFLQNVGCARFCSAGQVLIRLSASLHGSNVEVSGTVTIQINHLLCASCIAEWSN